MEVERTRTLQHVLDVIAQLSPEDRLMVIDIMERRSVDERRTEIARYASATLHSVREGRATYGTVADLKQDVA